MAEENNRWGIIYCPKEGKAASQKHWANIRKYLEEKQVCYDFVQSENKESVERLAAMLAANGYTTIVVVGGDAALYRALNGLMSVSTEQLSKIAFGVIPYGWANDFARFWGLSEEDYKKAVDTIVARRLRKVDIGYCTTSNSVKRYFLNCVNIGLVANIMKIKHKTQRFWGMRSLSFFSSMILLLFQRMEGMIHLKVNQDEIKQKVMTVCVGNSTGYGQTPSGVPYNGWLDVSVVSHPELTKMIEGLWMLVWGRYLNHKNVKPYRTKKIQVLAHDKACVSLDGAVLEDASCPMEIGIVPEAINFIIPL